MLTIMLPTRFFASKPIVAVSWPGGRTGTATENAIVDVRVSDDGKVTGATGLDSGENVFPQRPFLWSNGRLAWLSMNGYSWGSVVGTSAGRAVGCGVADRHAWALAWTRPPSGDWTAARPTRILPEPCSQVLVGKSGTIWLVSGKKLIHVEGGSRAAFPFDRCDLVAADAKNRLYGNVRDDGGIGRAFRFEAGTAPKPLVEAEARSEVHDADLEGNAVGHLFRGVHDGPDRMTFDFLPTCWRRGKQWPLLSLGSSADACAVNAGGDVVGWYDSGGIRRACLWQGGSCFVLPPYVGPGWSSVAVAVNRAGLTAVVAEDEDGRKLYLVPRP